MERMIVSSRPRASAGKTVVVTTPLDAIIRLERAGRIATVVLAGSYAADKAFAACLCELYPSIRVECEYA